MKLDPPSWLYPNSQSSSGRPLQFFHMCTIKMLTHIFPSINTSYKYNNNNKQNVYTSLKQANRMTFTQQDSSLAQWAQWHRGFHICPVVININAKKKKKASNEQAIVFWDKWKWFSIICDKVSQTNAGETTSMVTHIDVLKYEETIHPFRLNFIFTMLQGICWFFIFSRVLMWIKGERMCFVFIRMRVCHSDGLWAAEGSREYADGSDKSLLRWKMVFIKMHCHHL